ncbi:alpha/beta fold hydrolase [Nisaea acidiphila]|uniref:Alpha/beta fold hydrolase n=1 Tax=Nisaea acidiphila TaxID=1862145 RepID=A0A9J7AQM4_9PROT|nr:alpha/beta fold hydrolase [Nisaea acidiphila]UUX49470.1 alpha/beta fold hydrolase [Nisaea acidiphila]
MTEIAFLSNGPEDAPATLILAHGAGAAMDTPFMNSVADGIAEAGFRVLRFEFPYMAARRSGGKKRPPDRQPVLLECWKSAIKEASGNGPLFIGGKSMGGRMATLVAEETGVSGVICFGYPFHPPGKPDNLRTAHLESMTCPTLIIQGERDPFGTREETEGYRLSRLIRLQWAVDGNHDLAPRKASGHTSASNLSGAVSAAVAFLRDMGGKGSA